MIISQLTSSQGIALQNSPAELSVNLPLIPRLERNTKQLCLSSAPWERGLG